jgi:hypothetical protein
MVPNCAELFRNDCIVENAAEWGVDLCWGYGYMRDKKAMNDLSSIRRQRDDGLGATSDIGNKLRALYGAVQQEGIPDKLLDLLDRLDEVERQTGSKPKKGE